MQTVGFAAVSAGSSAGENGGGSNSGRRSGDRGAAIVQARIASPVHGSIIALDPGILPKNQRMQFAATAYGAGRWELDGKLMGAA